MSDPDLATVDLETYVELAEAMSGGDAIAALPTVALWLRQQAGFEDHELRAPLRRAVLVVAAGGDPHRELSADEVAVRRLAEELDAPERRAAVESALAALGAAAGRSGVSAAVASLADDRDLAWRWVALALLAEELAEEDPS